MKETVLPFRDVRKPSLVLIKGGRGRVAALPLTDDERCPRFPPAWVDWLVLGLLLAALNLPSPVPFFSIGAIVMIALLVARRITQQGGEDPNCHNGVTVLFASFLRSFLLKRPLERKARISPFAKQIVIFLICETTLIYLPKVFPASLNTEDSYLLTIVPFFGVTFFGLLALWWWDAPSAPKAHTLTLNTPAGSRQR